MRNHPKVIQLLFSVATDAAVAAVVAAAASNEALLFYRPVRQGIVFRLHARVSEPLVG